jgi:hypothetical protein
MPESLPQYCIHNVEGASPHVLAQGYSLAESFQVVTLTLDPVVVPNENLFN